MIVSNLIELIVVSSASGDILSRQDVPFVGIIDTSERDVLFVFEQSVEVFVIAVELEFCENQLDIGSNESAVA
jgi:hypothetical protein